MFRLLIKRLTTSFTLHVLMCVFFVFLCYQYFMLLCLSLVTTRVSFIQKSYWSKVQNGYNLSDWYTGIPILITQFGQTLATDSS